MTCRSSASINGRSKAKTWPIGQRRAFQRDAGASIDVALTIQRQVIAELRGQHMRKQRSAGPATADRQGWRRHSSIGYLSPIDYERRDQAAAVVPDAHQPAAVLAAVTDKPCGRPQDAAVLDRRCPRQPRHCAGRHGRMAPPGAEPKNATKQEDSMSSIT
jgi:hypothetical protein